ncbi:MAG: putative ABC transport system permease protein [Planctomycetota bacterium]|jgi:putative ABC transport system permease protein
MRHIILLAWRYLVDSKVRTFVIATGIGLTILLPLCVNLLVDRYSRELVDRSESTPLVIGMAGSRYDLVLNSLYFRGRVPRPLGMDELEYVQGSGLANPIPLLVRNTASDFPVVGTDLDYFEFRGSRIASGRLPLHLGECVLGASVAAELGMDTGATILSDQKNLYDLSKSYPLRMRVCGVLQPSSSADDAAVFCDLKTAWIIEGLGHGHQEAVEQTEDAVIAREGDRVVLNSSIVEFNEVTPENAQDFHFHGASKDLPLTAILLQPHNDRARTMLKGRYRVREGVQLLVPTEVIGELLGFVFQIKLFFDANTTLVMLATLLFLSTILLLSVQVRQRQMQTLARIGCARMTVAKILGTELVLTILLGLLIASAAALLLLTIIPDQAA